MNTFSKEENSSLVNPPNKKVLIITYYFPPSGGAGVQRTLRFLSNLSQFGWDPVILTTKNGDFPTKDLSLLNKVPVNTKIYRTYIPEPYRSYRRLTGRKRGEALDLSTLAVDESDSTSIAERFAAFIRTWFFIPDARIGWLPFAFFAGLKIIRQEKIDLIFSSAPPNTVHVIASALKRATGKKWVADFRDPWIKYLVPKRNSAVPRKLDLALNRMVVDRADHLIWVCEGVRKEVEETSGKKFVGKETIITNGFSEMDFENLGFRSTEKFTVTHVGTLYIRYDLTSLIEAIENIYSTRDDFKRDFELILCGPIVEQARKKLGNSKFHEHIQFLGYLDHKATLTRMVSSTLLLLYIIDSPEGKNIPTSKLFEYIGAKRPVFALAPQDSDAAEILNRTKSGIIVPPGDIAKIQSAILDLYQRWKQNGTLNLPFDAKEVQQFESKNLTRELVTVWNETLTKAD